LGNLSGAETIIRILRNEGIKFVFGNPGTTEVSLLDEMNVKRAPLVNQKEPFL